MPTYCFQSYLHSHQKRTLLESLQNTKIMPGFNDVIFDALKMKVEVMDDKCRCVSLVFDEMTLKSALVYNYGLDRIEGFEDLGESASSSLVHNQLTLIQ